MPLRFGTPRRRFGRGIVGLAEILRFPRHFQGALLPSDCQCLHLNLIAWPPVSKSISRSGRRNILCPTNLVKRHSRLEPTIVSCLAVFRSYWLVDAFCDYLK